MHKNGNIYTTTIGLCINSIVAKAVNN